MNIKCGWCGTTYPEWQNKCNACGGRMPPRPGMELGEEPSAIPRQLPKGYAWRRRLTNNMTSTMGLAIVVMGGLPGLILLLIFPWAALVAGLVVLGGLAILRHGLTTGSKLLKAFRHGIPVAGAVVAVTRFTEESMNGVSPWKLIYRFSLEGREYQGSLVAYDESIRERKPGQPLWVLYLREDPSINAVFPPFK